MVARGYSVHNDEYHFQLGYPADGDVTLNPPEAIVKVGEDFKFEVHQGVKGGGCFTPYREWWQYFPDSGDGEMAFSTDGDTDDDDRNDFYYDVLNTEYDIQDYGWDLTVTPLKDGLHYFAADLDGSNSKDYIVFGKIKAVAAPLDSDNDGVIDISDDFPHDRAASVDSDGDNYPDYWNKGYSESDSTTGLKLDAFKDDENENTDSDHDSVGDNTDKFPLLENFFQDQDGDLFPDEIEGNQDISISGYGIINPSKDGRLITFLIDESTQKYLSKLGLIDIAVGKRVFLFVPDAKKITVRPDSLLWDYLPLASVREISFWDYISGIWDIDIELESSISKVNIIVGAEDLAETKAVWRYMVNDGSLSILSTEMIEKGIFKISVQDGVDLDKDGIVNGKIELHGGLALSKEPYAAIISDKSSVRSGEKIVVSGISSMAYRKRYLTNFQWHQIKGPEAVIEAPLEISTAILIPQANSHKEFVFQLTVSDNRGATSQSQISLFINEAPDIILSPAEVDIKLGESATVTVKIIDSDQDEVNSSLVNSPDFVTLDSNIISIVPENLLPGDYKAYIQADDGFGGKTIQKLNIFIKKNNDVATLTITKKGTDIGRITSQPGNIDCTKDCITSNQTFEIGTQVVLTAKELDGATFNNWGGDALSKGTIESNTYTVNMDGDINVSAYFEPIVTPNSYSLIITKYGTDVGQVISSPSGIDCYLDCVTASSKFEKGTQVTLTAIELEGAEFEKWGGDATLKGIIDGNTCKINIDTDTHVSVYYKPKDDPNQVSLTLTKYGTDEGTIVSSPTGINCGLECVTQTKSFEIGSTVLLTANGLYGTTLHKWGGDALSSGIISGNTCQIKLEKDTRVSIYFKPAQVLSKPLGDLDMSGWIGLGDAIIAAETIAGLRNFDVSEHDYSDINGDGKIGFEELAYALTICSGKSSSKMDQDKDGFTVSQGDLNDSDSSIYPGAPETCGDGIDQDCNGSDLACQEVDLKEGLVLYYPFNGNADDASGNNVNGKVFGATLTADRNGNKNSAYRFDGDRDYVEVGSTSDFNFIHDGSDFTISTWVKHNTEVEKSGILGNTIGGDRKGFFLGLRGNDVYFAVGRTTPYPVVSHFWEDVIQEGDHWVLLSVTYNNISYDHK